MSAEEECVLVCFFLRREVLWGVCAFRVFDRGNFFADCKIEMERMNSTTDKSERMREQTKQGGGRWDPQHHTHNNNEKGKLSDVAKFWLAQSDTSMNELRSEDEVEDKRQRQVDREKDRQRKTEKRDREIRKEYEF